MPVNGLFDIQHNPNLTNEPIKVRKTDSAWRKYARDEVLDAL